MSRTSPLIPYLLAASSGLLGVLAFPDFNFSLLSTVALVPLFLALSFSPGGRQRFLLGWLAGSIYWGGACYWIFGVLHDYAGVPAAVSVALFLGFFLAKGLYWGVFSLVAAPLLRSAWAVPGLSAAWVAVEGLHQYVDFTWLHLGNAATNMSVLMRLAPYAGVYGVSFALAMMNVAVALALLRRPRIQLAWLALLPLLFLLPALPEPKPGRSIARLVQPNIHPDTLVSGVWTPSRSAEHLERMRALSTEEADKTDPTPPELLIWPEYPVPAYFFDSPGWRAYMENLARQTGAYFIFNTVAFEDTNGRHPLNGAVTLSPSGSMVSRYAKIFLVPFGEFVPWPFSLFVDKITLEAGDFVPGSEVAVALAGEHRVGTFICYESAFARGIREFVARGAEVLVNISNDSWYGRSAARQQHLLLARMRAVENGRWLLRATNDGITCTIDPAGRVVAALPSFEEGVLCGRFNYESDRTWFVRFGQWFWWACVASTAAFLAAPRLRSISGGRTRRLDS